MTCEVTLSQRSARPLTSRRGTRRRAAAVLVAVLAVTLALGVTSTRAAAQGAPTRNQPGPYDIALFNTPQAPDARGTARLISAESPFGIAVTTDGRARYDALLTISGLPAPSSLGHYTAYVAWEVSPDLTVWTRLGTVQNGTSTVGTAELNKFLLVITAEATADDNAHAGPTVLHGTSPSGWLQSFLSHPLFRGVY
ncbi:MAG TPA: hypothetical protein VFK13_13340 [Gemmatimonadaceae bacterium]|nr:hypothetical protein [Gemmatimonadaceae bacterium]